MTDYLFLEVRESTAYERERVELLANRIRSLVADEVSSLVETVLCNLLAGQIANYAGNSIAAQNEMLETYKTVIISALVDGKARKQQ